MPMPSAHALATPRRRIFVGIDGSLCAYGGAILELVAHRPTVLRAGCILTSAPDDDRYRADKDGERLDAIAAWVLALLDAACALSSDVTAIIEAPGGSKSSRAIQALGQAYGVSRTACAAKRIARRTVPAGAVKLLLTGDRNADKRFLRKPVLALTGWSSAAATKEEVEAETDAVGVALTGIEQSGAYRTEGARP